MRVRVVHWKDSEAEPLLQACRDCGFEVEYTAKDLPLIARAIRTTMPDALIIDLTRLPSHGRELALAVRSRKYSRGIPIVFVDGAPEKVEAIRRTASALLQSESSLRQQISQSRSSPHRDGALRHAHQSAKTRHQRSVLRRRGQRAPRLSFYAG